MKKEGGRRNREEEEGRRQKEGVCFNRSECVFDGVLVCAYHTRKERRKEEERNLRVKV